MNNIKFDDDDNFEEEFLKAFQGFERHDIPEHNWVAIESEIPKKSSFLKQNWKKSSILLLLLLISTCVYRTQWASFVVPNVQNTIVQLPKNKIDKSAISEGSKAFELRENKNTPSVEKGFSLYKFNKKGLIQSNKSNDNNLSKNNFLTNDLVLQNDKGKYIKKDVFALSKDNNFIEHKSTTTIKNDSFNAFMNQRLDTINDKIVLNTKTDLIPFLPILNTTKMIDFNKNKLENTFNSIVYTTQNRYRKSGFYLSLTPQYNFYNFYINTDDDVFLSNFEMRNSLLNKRLDVKIETGIFYRLNKNWQLNTSINARTVNKDIAYIAQTELKDSFQIKSIDALNIRVESVKESHKLHEQNTYFLIGFNSGIQFNINQWFIESGIGVNYLLNAPKMTVLNIELSIGFKQKINTKYDLNIAPQMTYFIEKKTFSSPVLQANPYSIGLKLSVLQR
jgi:hypothetical protein